MLQEDNKNNKYIYAHTYTWKTKSSFYREYNIIIIGVEVSTVSEKYRKLTISSEK